MTQKKKRKSNPLKGFTRWLRNSFWYFLVLVAGIAFQNYAPLEGSAWWLALIGLAGLLQIIVSLLRGRLRF
jgi:hypothetical protein